MWNNVIQNINVNAPLNGIAKKTKVAFFSDILVRDFDGANKTMFHLIDRIPNDRFDYMFFCGVPPESAIKHRIVTIPTATIPYNNTYKMALPDLCKARLFNFLDFFKPDVIHIATPSALGFFALNYALKNGIPVLSIYHTHFISYMKYYFKYLPSFLINLTEGVVAKSYRNFYNKCNITYVPTTQIANELTEHGVSMQHCKLWQRGINTSMFTPRKRDKSYMKSLTKNNNPCILFASRLVWEKNLETLFAVYDQVQARQLKVNFIVAGSGVAEEAARERMKNATFLGFVNHDMLAKVYASSDIFLFPSVSESYGNVVVEAMASGCVPVIAKGGGSQSLVSDGETGFLCSPNDASDYVDKITKLLKNNNLRKKMQSAGLNYTSMLNWDNLAEEYFRDVKSLAGYSISLNEKQCI